MSDVYDRLVKLLTSAVGLEEKEIGRDDTLEALDLDSLALVELSLAVQSEFGVPVADDDLSAGDTVAQAAELIEGKTAELQ